MPRGPPPAAPRALPSSPSATPPTPTSIRSSPMRDPAPAGDGGGRMYALVEELYPICRSITGDGVRDSLARIARQLPAPLVRTEVPTGTPVLDWTVPNEWNIRDAWIADASGARV